MDAGAHRRTSPSRGGGRSSSNAAASGFGGPVRFRQQRVALSTHVGGWKDFFLSRYLRRTFRGSSRHGQRRQRRRAGRRALSARASGCSPLFYMTLSTGIGGGILMDGRIQRGADSWAGEIGHLNIEPEGPDCLCGSRGCLERMCCGLWLERDYGKTAQELMRDPEFVARYVVRLARGLKACIMLLNPARIVIGGGIAKAGRRALRAVAGGVAPPGNRLVGRASGRACRRRWWTTACSGAPWD